MRTPASSVILALAAAAWGASFPAGGTARADEREAEAGLAPEPGRGSPLDRAAAGAVEAILQAGFDARSIEPAAIERLALSAGKPGPRDSRVEYARGLVLLKHLKHREAVAAFEAATQSAPPCLPAWHALVRAQLTLKQADAALARAEELADPRAGWPHESGVEAAAWLGRLAGYLALDGVDLVQPAALVAAHEARVRLALGEGRTKGTFWFSDD
ncbi:MAG TPA: hypothetical protein VML55_09955, partial [Planctomycetaceae bacterium]|nr:hypothetical protein [Planctomycetaceae bacterium]